TPSRGLSPAALKEVKNFWKLLGCRVLSLSPEDHDVLVSRCSHLPHLLAAQLTHFVLDPKHPTEQRVLCANGFRDTTRIASGSPEMWRDIAMANRKNLAKGLDTFIRRLSKMKRAIKAGNSDRVGRFFSTAKERRDGWVIKASSASPE